MYASRQARHKTAHATTTTTTTIPVTTATAPAVSRSMVSYNCPRKRRRRFFEESQV
jgi:hypothetical protein